MTITRLHALATVALALGVLSNAQADQVPGNGGNCAPTWDTRTATVTGLPGPGALLLPARVEVIP